MAALLAVALVSTLGVLVPAGAPAGADTVTTSATLHLACTADSPIGAQAAEQDLTIAIDHPDKIARNSVETVVISQPPLAVPTEVAGYPLVSLSNINVAIKVPAQFRIDSAVTVAAPLTPGAIATAATVAYSATGDATLTIPGPLAGGNTYQIPELHIGLRAVGTPGTTGGFLFQSFNVTARATLPVFGASNLPTTCPTPSPNPPMFGIEVAPGAFSTDADPVTTVATVQQPTVVKYGSSTVPGSGRTDNPVDIAFTSVPDVAPGGETTVSIGVGGRDWMAPYRVSPHQTYTAGLITSGRDVTGMRDWTMTLNAPDPAVFTVMSVVSDNPTVMTATYQAGTNTIVLARPAGAAGELAPGAAFLPPAVKVKVKAVGTGPYRQTATFGFEKLSFGVGYRSIVCLFACTNPGSTWIGATTTGPAPGGAPVGTQPNNSVYFPATAKPVIGEIGIAVNPGTVNDTATVANNVPGVDIDVLANDVVGTDPFDPETVTIVDEPTAGTVTVDPITGRVFYAPEYGTLTPSDGFTYAVKDTEGRWSNVSSVNITIIGLYCVAPCSLTQTIEVDVLPDGLTLSQDNGATVLHSVSLNGDAQTTTGPLQPLTVINRRGTAAPWSLTGQLTSDFRGSDADPECPAGTPASWNWTCIPGDNLGWEPLASVAHDVVPGDVAEVDAGPVSTAGLRSAAQSLCTSPGTRAGGTFSCGAVLSLGVPASASAQGYSATITLTLA